MATEKQIQANRNNAQNSTGPRTEQGKSRASQNALKHGLCANAAVIPGEDPAEFEAQLAGLEADIQPEGALECELVRQIADAQWRMQRLARLETACLNAALDNERQINAEDGPRPRHYSDKENTLMLGYSLMGNTTNRLAQLARYDAHLGRRFERAIQQIARLREVREKRQPAQAKQVNREPRRSAGGPHPAPARIPKPSPAASAANNQTKPISFNPNEINKVEPVTSVQRHPDPAAFRQIDPQPGHSDIRHNTNVPAGRETNHPHGPIPARN